MLGFFDKKRKSRCVITPHLFFAKIVLVLPVQIYFLFCQAVTSFPWFLFCFVFASYLLEKLKLFSACQAMCRNRVLYLG